MKRNIIALGLATGMLLSLCACGETSSQSSAESPAESSSTSAEASSESAAEPAGDESYFPLADPVNVTIAAVRHDDYTEVGKTTFMQHMEEKTNVKVEWLDWPQSVLSERRGLAFSGNDVPDALYGSYILSNSSIIEYGSQGYFVDFKPYIENGSMPNLSKAIEREPQLLSDITTPNGCIYALPAVQLGEGLQLTSDATLINKTWLDKVEKEIPTTTEELYDVLKAFKEAGDLNGNGKDDEIPMTFRYGDNNNGCWSVFGWFGKAGGTSRVPVVGDDGKLVFAQATDEYKDAMTYLNRLYSEGLLDPEIFTMDSATYNAKTIAEEPVAGVLVSWSTYQVNTTIINGDEYVYLPPLQSDNGKTPQWQVRAYAYNRTPAFLISADSEYIEELVKWADLCYDFDNSVEAMYGGEEFYKSLGDGKYEMVLDANGNETTWTSRSAACPGNDSLSLILLGDFEVEPKKQSAIEKEAADEIFGPYRPEKFYNELWYTTEEESANLSKYTTDFFSYLDQMAADFITKGDVDAKWDEYISQLESLHMSKMLENYQSVYDRNN